MSEVYVQYSSSTGNKPPTVHTANLVYGEQQMMYLSILSFNHDDYFLIVYLLLISDAVT